MITLQLSGADAELLEQQIRTRLEHLQHELVHTDDRALHRALAGDLDRLEALATRIGRARERETSDVVV